MYHLIFSEPGYYQEKQFGVRLENILLVEKSDTKVNKNLYNVCLSIILFNFSIKINWEIYYFELFLMYDHDQIKKSQNYIKLFSIIKL